MRPNRITTEKYKREPNRRTTECEGMGHGGTGDKTGWYRAGKDLDRMSK